MAYWSVLIPVPATELAIDADELVVRSLDGGDVFVLTSKKLGDVLMVGVNSGATIFQQAALHTK